MIEAAARANRLFEQSVRNVAQGAVGAGEFPTPDTIKFYAVDYINSRAARRLDLIRGLASDTYKQTRYRDAVNAMVDRLCYGDDRDLCESLKQQTYRRYNPSEIKSVTPSWRDNVKKFGDNFSQGASSFISRFVVDPSTTNTSILPICCIT